MATSNPFSGFTAAELTELRAAYKQCLLDIMTTGQSYAINGRNMTAADQTKVETGLANINAAIAAIGGTQSSFAVAVTA